VAFLQTTKKNYLAEAEAVDFAESQMAVTIINNFVEKMTNGLIKDFLQSINPATRFYLFNG
jgi:serine protease inhibitor